MKWFSKSLIIFLIIFFLLGLSINAMAQAKLKPVNITLVAGTVGGVWHAMAEGVAETIRREAPGSVVNVVPGGDAANILRVSQKGAEFVFAYIPTVKAALAGTGQFENKKVTNILAVNNIYTSYYHIVFLKKTGFTTLDDIIKKKAPVRISMNQRASLMHVVGEEIIKEYGATLKDIESWGGKVHFLASQPGNDLMRGGHLDGFFSVGPLPMSQTSELTADHELVLFPIKDSVRESLYTKFGALKAIIPANTYKGQPKDVDSVTIPCLIITNKDIPADTVYTVTRAIGNNKEHLWSVHKDLKVVNPKYMSDTAGVTIHAGAERYYKEVGVLK